jgi:hypothetical protein
MTQESKHNRLQAVGVGAQVVRLVFVVLFVEPGLKSSRTQLSKLLNYHDVAQWSDSIGHLKVTESNDDQVRLSFLFNRLYRWVEPYTFERHFDCLSEQYGNFLKGEGGKEYKYNAEDFSLPFTIDKSLPLQTEIERCEKLLIGLHESVIQELHERGDR